MGADAITVSVNLGARSYPVIIGNGVSSDLHRHIPAGAKRAAVVTQQEIPIKVDPGIEYEVFRIGSGEQHKTLNTISDLCSSFARMGLTRNDVVVAVGGGMVTDVAGFAASVFHRGLRVVHVATTLLGMVDAAIGGKTGVNLPEGKNLVGSFWQPSAVLCEMNALETLPEAQLRGGLGELAKYHFISGDDFLSLDLANRIARAVAIKAEIVESDEREGGRRALLNYGHTLGHAIEIATDFAIQHGEAVAVGLVYAAHLAASMNRITAERVDDHYRVVGETYGLSTSLPQGCKPEDLLELMARDKKALNGLTFVLDSEKGLQVVEGVPADKVLSAFDAMALR